MSLSHAGIPDRGYVMVQVRDKTLIAHAIKEQEELRITRFRLPLLILIRSSYHAIRRNERTLDVDLDLELDSLLIHPPPNSRKSFADTNPNQNFRSTGNTFSNTELPPSSIEASIE